MATLIVAAAYPLAWAAAYPPLFKLASAGSRDVAATNTFDSTTNSTEQGTNVVVVTNIVVMTNSLGTVTNILVVTNPIPPIDLVCPAGFMVPADASGAGAVVTYAVGASGGCSPPLVTTQPPSGSYFPVGTTMVEVTAMDSCGGIAMCGFPVVVVAPLTNVVGNTNSLGYTNTVGNTNVVGNTNIVVVTNNFPPVQVVCPPGITVQATGAGGAVVTFAPVASGGCTPPVVTTIPLSGSTFPVGTTTVLVTATDTCGGMATCSFPVTVAGPVLTNAPPVECFSPTNCLPATNSVYISPAQFHLLYNQGIVIRDVRHRAFTRNLPPPKQGSSKEAFGSTLDFQLSQDGGQTFTEVKGAPAAVEVTVTVNTNSEGASVYDTQMTTLDVSGGSLPTNIVLRASTNIPSGGQTTIRPVSGGYMIASHFDITAEISMDGGNTWMAPQNAGHMEMRLDPIAVAAPVGEPTSLLPAPNDGYISPALYHALFANGVVIRNLSHRFFTGYQQPPPNGSTNAVIEQFDSQVIADVSLDGGQTFTSLQVPAPVQVQLTSQTVTPGSTSALFDTQMIELGANFPVNGTTVMLRVSQSAPSTGETEVDTQADGTFQISSFFDIQLEVSLDGGQTWTPQTNGPVRMQLTPIAPEVPNKRCALPPVGGQYVSPAQWHAAYANGVILTNVNHRRFVQSFDPPGPGVVTNEFFGSEVDMQVSLDGGQTFSNLVAQGDVSVTVSNHANVGSTIFLDTQMTQLDVSGGSLPPGMQVRQSPTLASLGRASVRTNAPGDYRISSYFQIFTEVSLDGGLTWSPMTSQPATMAHAPTVTNTTAAINLAVPANVTVAASGTDGMVVFFNATAVGGCSVPVVTAAPPSGSTFPLGVTTVNVTAADTCGGTASGSFTVTVTPPNPPTNCVSIACPTALSVTAAVPTAVFFNVAASDACGGTPVATSIPPSGSLFPVGTTTVTSTATDANGTATCSFTVTVAPPGCAVSIQCPPNMTVTSVGPSTVFFTVTATDSCGGTPVVTSVPPSGSVFPVGTTTVTSTATDASGTATCSFTVTVKSKQRVFPTGNNIPPTNSVYISPAQWHAQFAHGIYISNVVHRAFTASYPPPSPGRTNKESFGSKVDFMYSSDGGNTFQSFTGDAQCTVAVVGTGTNGADQMFQNQMVQLDLNGGKMPTNMMLRISPNPGTPSAGSTIITPLGADFLISSSFNMYVDLSLDGGNTWMPSSTPGDMELHIDPANPPTILAHPAYQNNAASFDIPTQPGLLYTVQYSTSLLSPNWTVLQSLSGNRTTIVVTDPNGNQPQRFYRVVIQEDPNP